MRQDHEQTTTRGLFIVHTGNGKGKTSAAMNLVYRHLAHGKTAKVVQFIKRASDFDYGDARMLERLASTGAPVALSVLGAGFTWNGLAASEHQSATQAAWECAALAIADPQVDLVVCDELHIALSKGHLELERVLDAIASRPSHCHVVTTGRYAPEALIDAADLVTEFVERKHPLKLGVRAQAGIEY
jgi:cob(I)alamin adenosyltransferase